jgi:hypothetical protein
MGDPKPELSDPRAGQQRPRSLMTRALPLATILLVAAGLRFWGLTAKSLWYDEVITMHVARTKDPAALLDLIVRIEGTRAPLHFLVLQGWLKVFGTSDLSARSLSALLGVAGVAVVYLVGRSAYDARTGQWAAWLSAVCPPLVYYAQEARMYTLLVLLTGLSWLVLLSFRHAAGAGRCVVYALLLLALPYTQPLGLFMIAAHGLAYLIARPALLLSFPRWSMIQVGVMLGIAPWMRHYLDHGTDYPMPYYKIRYLLAAPTEWIGGNSLVLPICLAIVAVGLVTIVRGPDGDRRRLRVDRPVEGLILIVWAVVPPVLIYAYSFVGVPIFGPSRYHLYSAPAYLVLVGHGLARLPPLLRWPMAGAGLVLSMSLLQTYAPTIKADWRGLAAWLERHHPQAAPGAIAVVVHPSDPRFLREQPEAARYYLSPRFRVIAAGSNPEVGQSVTYEVYCLSQPHPIRDEGPIREAFYGLIVK